MPGEWYAESLRVTYFVTGAWAQRPLYEEVVGSPPAERMERPQVATHQETGYGLGAFLTIAQQPGRVDFVLSDSPATPLASSPDEKHFYWAGPYNSCIVEFEKLISGSSQKAAHCVRTAIGIALLKQTNTVVEAMEILKERLPTLDFDPRHDGDLIYQISRMKIDRDGRELTCIARWDAIRTRAILLTPSFPGTAGATQDAFAARIYADVSTNPDNKSEFDKREVIAATSSCVSMAREIAEHKGG
jgi:hypothetical protein